MSKQGNDINDAQKKFCREYIFDYNGTRAYQEAYPKCSYDAARVEASKLLTKPNIQSYIKELQSDLEKVSGISRLKVLEEYKKMAFSSIAHLHNSWIERKEFEELTDDQKACISEIYVKVQAVRGKDGKMQDYEYVKVKLYDKHKSLDSISKMLGYNEPTEIDGQLTVKIVRE